MKFNEWIVILDGKRIDNKGYFCSAQCVTAYSKKEALRILSKAKLYYFGSYRLEAGTKKIDTKPSNFKGLEPISFTQEKKLYKYFYGDETDYEACKKRLAEAKSKGYKSAYIVTFDNK